MPRLIRDQDVDTDLPNRVNDDQVTRDGLGFPLPGEASELDTAIHMFKISKILGHTLESLYTTTRRRGAVVKITRLQAELDLWESAFLSNATSNNDDDGAFDEVNDIENSFNKSFLAVLKCITVFHVHRPALTFSTTHNQFSISLKQCCHASATLIDVISRTTHNTLISIYPNGLHILWQAGLTVLFAMWNGKPYSEDASSDQSLLILCISTLRRFGNIGVRENDMVMECVDVLDRLQKRTFEGGELPEYDQWNIWDWPMTAAIELENNLSAVPLDLDFDSPINLQ